MSFKIKDEFDEISCSDEIYRIDNPFFYNQFLKNSQKLLENVFKNKSKMEDKGFEKQSYLKKGAKKLDLYINNYDKLTSKSFKKD